jgi:hypothetical protein
MQDFFSRMRLGFTFQVPLILKLYNLINTQSHNVVEIPLHAIEIG